MHGPAKLEQVLHHPLRGYFQYLFNDIYGVNKGCVDVQACLQPNCRAMGNRS